MPKIVTINPLEGSKLQERVFDLLCTSLSSDPQRPRKRDFFAYVQIRDPWFHYCERRVLFLESKAVSNVDLFTREMWIGRCPILVGDIGNICTHPSYRGRGFASGLIGNTLQYMRKKGYNLSILLGIWSGYERLGWATIPGKKAIVRAEKVRTKDSYKLREYQKKDFKEIVNIYEIFNRHRTGSTIRTNEYWKKHIHWATQAPNNITVLEKGGEVVAYARCKVVGNNLLLSEVSCIKEGPKLFANILRGIVNYTHENNYAGISTGILSEDHPLIEALNQKDLWGECKESKGIMARFVNLRSLFEKISPELEERLKCSSYSDWEGSITFQCELDVVMLKIKNGSVKTGDEIAGSIFLPLDQNTMFKLIFGYPSVIRELSQKLNLTTEEIGLLRSLFPKQRPIHWARDHF